VTVLQGVLCVISGAGGVVAAGKAGGVPGVHAVLVVGFSGRCCVLWQVRDREEAARISNAYAPEHLIINVEDPESWLQLLDNAGSIFMGRWGAQCIGCECRLHHRAAAMVMTQNTCTMKIMRKRLQCRCGCIARSRLIAAENLSVGDKHLVCLHIGWSEV